MANEKRYAITLDIYEKLDNVLPFYVQQDLNFLDISITDKGTPVDLTGTTAVIKNETGDVFGGTEQITILNDVITWKMNSNATRVTGVIKAEVRLITTIAQEEKVTTYKFEYKVRKELANGEITPENEQQAQTLEELITEVDRILDETDDFMTRSVYDTNDSGVVDNSEALEGQNGAFYLDRTNHTGTQSITTLSDFEAPIDGKQYARKDAGWDEIIDAGGDMTKAIYDPTNVNADTFSMGNMVETATEKIFTDTERTKLTGIEANAEVNVQSDWNQTINTEDDFIKNKPTDLTDLSLHSVTELNDVTDAGSGAIITTEERDFLGELQLPTYTPITLENAFNKLDFIVDGSEEVTEIRGRTLNNFADNGVDYVNWIVSGLSTKGTNGIHMEHPNDNPTLPTDLLESTTYTVFYEILDKNIVSGTFNFEGSGVLDADVFPSDEIGVHSAIMTTRTNITQNIFILKIGSSVTGEFVDFKIYAILEGDQTNLDIQNSLPFGINSANVDSLKTIGKNLINKDIYDTYDIRGGDGSIAIRNWDVSINGQTITSNFNSGFYDLSMGGVINVENIDSLNFNCNVIQGECRLVVFEYSDVPKIGDNPSFLAFNITSTITSGLLNLDVTLNSNTKFVLAALTTTIINTCIIENVILSNLTSEFIPYQEYIEPISKALNGFNNVFDTIEETTVEIDGENVRQNAVIEKNNPRVFIGDVSESWANVASALTTVYRFNTNITTDALGGVGTSIAILEGITLNDVESDVLDEEHYYIDSTTQEFNTFILKTKIDPQPGATLTDKYNNYLAINNLDTIYNLNSNSYVTTPFLDYNNNLPCYEDGHLQINYTDLPPSLDVNYPTNKGAEWDSTTALATSNAEQVNNIWTTLLPIADKELAMANVDLLTVDTNPELQAKINEIINIWKV